MSGRASAEGPMFAAETEALAAPGEVYKHYKGGVYRVLQRRVRHTETEELGVVYEHLWPNPHGVYFRPESVFFGTLADGSPRFARVSRLQASREDRTMSVDVAAAHYPNGCICGHSDCPCPVSRPRTSWKGSAGEIARTSAALEGEGVPSWDSRHEEMLMARLSHPAKLRRLHDRNDPDRRQRIDLLDASLRVKDGDGLGLLLTDGFSTWRPHDKTADEQELRAAYFMRRGKWLRIASPSEPDEPALPSAEGSAAPGTEPEAP